MEKLYHSIFLKFSTLALVGCGDDELEEGEHIEVIEE